MTKYKYLGVKVRDIGKEGLDSPEEFKQIADAIIRDYKNGEIDEATARGRLLLLYRLTYPTKNKKVRSWSASTRRRIRNYILHLMRSL